MRWLAPLYAAARMAGFIVPEPQQGSNGRLLYDGWTVEPVVEGTTALVTDMPALAPRIRAFHAACPVLSQRPGFWALPDLLQQLNSGDIDLTALPDDVLPGLRQAWAGLADAPVQAIHGDLGPGNLILSDQGPGLIDWDESRVDLPGLDLIHSAALPAEITRAHLALEIASCWQAEPDHARQLLARF